MVFTTYLFVFYFLPLVLVFYYALDGLSRAAGASDGRTCMVLNTFLVLASYIFYGWWNPWFILLMLGITVVNYVCGRIIGLPGISRQAEPLGRDVRHRREPGHPRVLQVFPVLRGQPEPGARPGSEPEPCECSRSPCPSGSRSTRSMRSATPSTSIAARLPRSVVHRFRLLHRTLSAARRRADHPLQHGGRSAREPLPHLGEVCLGGHPVRPRLRQEDLAGQSDGPGRGRRVRRPVAFRAGCLVRRTGLRVPDLLRFLRLFRHGHRPGTDVRLRVPQEFRFTVQGREHHGLLAALAHLAEYVLARLSLHSSWRQPQGPAAHLR